MLKDKQSVGEIITFTIVFWGCVISYFIYQALG